MSVATSETTKLVASLYQIAGLEVDQALERLLHNETLYTMLIKRFIQEREHIVDQMESALTENNMQELSNLAHSFKSLAGTIGATQLQALALDIEIGVSQRQNIEPLLRDLRRELETLIRELRERLGL